jgi:hypothetical protein
MPVRSQNRETHVPESPLQAKFFQFFGSFRGIETIPEAGIEESLLDTNA